MLAVWFLGAACIVASLYVTAARVLPVKLILGYATVIDVVFTVLLIVVFHGSLTGLMSATLAGLLMACSLSFGRWLLGYQRLSLRRVGVGFTVETADTPGKIDHIKERISVCINRLTTLWTIGRTGTYGS